MPPLDPAFMGMFSGKITLKGVSVLSETAGQPAIHIAASNKDMTLMLTLDTDCSIRSTGQSQPSWMGRSGSTITTGGKYGGNVQIDLVNHGSIQQE